MNKSLLTALLFAVSSLVVKAQNFTVTSLSHEGIELKKYDKDENAHAVVLDERGEVRFTPGSYGRVMIYFEHHVRIKIFDQKGLKYGKVEIPIYNGDQPGMEETVDEIRGYTVYKDANGLVKTQEFNDRDMSTVKKNKNNKLVKFELPNLKSGCIVDYTYRFTTPFLQNLHTWMFQSDLPKTISKFETFIPHFWSYNIMLRGAQKLTTNTTNRVGQCYISGTLKADCIHTLYEMKDIPAFVEEEYMSSPKNFMSAIYFELSSFKDPYSSKTSPVATSWEELDTQFDKDEFFGGNFKRIDFLNNKIAPVTNGLTDQLDKAKVIFKFIQKNVTWDSAYATSSLAMKKVLDKHTGDSGDINLLLTAALRAGGVQASPVLLSTRDHGMINKQYPNPTAFNHVIAQAKIEDKIYLLDATDKMVPFGILPVNCLNDKGRVLSLDEPPHWLDITANQTQNTTYLFNLTLEDNNKIKGTITSRFSNHAAYAKRYEIKKFKTTNEYAESLEKKTPSLKILKSEINNLDSLDYPLTESFDIELNTGSTEGGSISFNPYLINQILTNPFKSEDRKYPIDLGMASDTKIIVNINYPETYAIENPPQSTALSLAEQGGRFSITAQSNDNSFSLTNILSLKKPVYTVDEYQQLRELYDKIIEQEKYGITLKKKI